MQKRRPEKSEALTAATGRASSEVTQDSNQGHIMSDSKAVQVSSQPVFNFGAHSVRVVVREGEPWFVASDVCAALDYKNTSKAVADHLDEDERMTLTSGYGQSEGGLTTGSTGAGKRGGARFTVVINESGLYALVLRSRKPEARKFAKWVTSEVLPAIRKTGVYVGKPFTVNPGDVLTAEEQNTLRLMLKSAVERLPKEKQAGAMVKGWSKLKAHFGVPYREIPRQEFSEAVSIIARHTAEWELVEEDPEIETSSLRAMVRSAGRSANGDWVISVVCGECGFGVCVPDKVMRNGGVKAGDLIRLEYAKGGSPFRDDFVRVSLWDEFPPRQSKWMLPEEQAHDIAERLDRLCKLFNPLSSPYNDVLGVIRALKGADSKTGFARAGFRQLMPSIAMPSQSMGVPA